MKSIGIVTYYNALNCGAFLQAYSLNNFLVQKGFSPVFIPVLRPCVSKTDTEDAPPFFSEFTKNLQSCYTHLDVATGSDREFDVIIYGSDEIWNLRNHGWSPKLWGFLYKSNMKISYAACVGNTHIIDFLLFPYTIWGLNRFEAISVRDNYSYRLLSRFTNKRISEVLDPTFLTSYDQFKKENKYGDYILVYTYGLTIASVQNIRIFANEKMLKLICTGSCQPWADLNLSVGPFDWLSLIYNAKYIITSTFHGTVFSIICKKQFVVIDSSSIKILDILEKLCLQNRHTEDLYNAFSDEIDYKFVDSALDPLIEESKSFLMDSISDE